MRRVIVLGGLGLFGRTIAEQLRNLAIPVQIASRSSVAEVQIDADNRESIQTRLREGDVVVDAAGPFHERSTALIDAALEIGFDVVDINDNLRYAESILALRSQIDAAGIRVLSSASSVSAVAAAVLRHSGVTEPRRLTTFLAPATRYTANAGTALSLINSVGQPIRIFRDGRLQSHVGWSESRCFSMPRLQGNKHPVLSTEYEVLDSGPMSQICGRLFESADSVYLPCIWPSLRDVAMYVDTNIPWMNSLLRLAASSSAVRGVLRRGVRVGTAIARRLGSSVGGIGYENEDASGGIYRYAITSEKHSFLTAIAPAVLATRAIVEDRYSRRGLILPDQQVEPVELFEFLNAAGIKITPIN
jgi:short subunit dehydrogenase-like uncharacterized protein